jgi:hypothetical protein
MTIQGLSAARSFHNVPSPTGTESEILTVPYAGENRMRLRIASGLATARVVIDPDATELIALDCGEGPPPRLHVSASELRVSFPGTLESWLRAAFAAPYRHIEIVLHPTVEWALVIRGGLSDVDADLTAGRLARLEVSGGISDARFDLPPAEGAVPIRISGGVSDFALRRPAATGVTLAVSGGISGLGLDEQRFDAIGGGAELVTGSVHGDDPRYTVEISGGASGLRIAAR